MRHRRLLFCLLVLLPIQSFADVSITRKVTKDSFTTPTRPGTEHKCPERDPLESGDLVRLWVHADMARRDAGSLSIIVRLDLGKAFVLYHDRQTYIELAFPPKIEQLQTSFQEDLGEAAEEFFPFQPDGTVQETSATAVGRDVVVRRLTVDSPFLGRLDIEMEIAPDVALGAAAFGVEAMAQALRYRGESWMMLLGAADGIPLSIRLGAHLPSAMVHAREELSGLEAVDFDAERFSPPAAYTKVDYDPSCF